MTKVSNNHVIDEQSGEQISLNTETGLQLIPGRVYLVSADRRIKFVNQNTIDYLGRDPTGEICHEVMADCCKPCSDCILEEVIAGKHVSLDVEDQSRGDWAHYRHVPVRDKDGEPCKLTIAQDITPRKNAELQLHNSEEKYRLLLENLDELVFTLTPQGQFTYLSSAFERLIDFDGNNLVGNTFEQFVVPEDLPGLQRDFQRCLNGEPMTVEFRTLKKNGSHRHIRVSARGRYDGDQLVEITGVMSDLSDLRQAEEEKRGLEEQLHQSQKMEALGRLAGGVAHDFNNLLFVIINQANFLAQTLGQDPASQKRASQIETAAERAADLTRQLLLFSRRKPVKPKAVDLAESLDELEEMLARIVGEDITLRVNKVDSLDYVLSDPAHIGQVLMNLVANSRDAMPRGGCLTIDTAQVEFSPDWVKSKIGVRPGHYVELRVQDTGSGMTDEVRERVFEPFFTTKPGGLGSGLGMANVYSVIKQSGGFIEIDSAPDEGTTFRVYFRCTQEAPSVTPAQGIQSLPDMANKTILLVEDEESVRGLVRSMLSKMGAHTMVAPDAETALRLAEEHEGPIHLLLTDVIMPVMSGRQLAKKLLAERPGLNVLYMSGYTGDAIAQHGLVGDDLHILFKPFKSQQLLSKLHEVLRHKQPA